MSEKFEIGQQVVAIDVDNLNIYLNYYFKIGIWSEYKQFYLGDVYTIRGFRCDCEDIDLTLVFEEFNIINIVTGVDVAFDARGFRPVKKTNIDTFTEMLNNQPILETI